MHNNSALIVCRENGKLRGNFRYNNAGFARTTARASTGASVGDLFMSIIHTCILNGVNPFDYLTELEKHPAHLRENPEKWLPWNYEQNLGK